MGEKKRGEENYEWDRSSGRYVLDQPSYVAVISNARFSKEQQKMRRGGGGKEEKKDKFRHGPTCARVVSTQLHFYYTFGF